MSRRSGSATPAPAAAAGTISLGDLTVNRMGFGAMRLTGKGIWGEPRDRAEAVRVLRRAVELGVDFIDTADSYGPNVSEEIIAEALHPYPDGLVIATKGGFLRPGPDKWVMNGRPEHLRRQLEGSLRRLRLDRQLGLSEVGVEDIDAARRVVPIVSVQNIYNAGDRKWDSVVEYSEREGLAFIPWFPLSAGDIEEGGPLERVARRHGVTVYQAALAWLLARSPAMLVIPGTSSTPHLEENVAAAELRLTPEDLRELG
jgi:pyridoxine 4-dehydrogenase